ncbi:MAG: histidine triad nucleotide-binding protein [Acidobacteria bacterium]|nr:histidine triad nucleotide-binding protein [Acidobacteriota bacterium]
MTEALGCVFCRIAAHQAPAKILYEDDQCVAFEDIRPRAPVHALVIPKKHIAALDAGLETDEALLGHLLVVSARVAREKGIDRSGFRTVINTNAGAGQTVFHLHLHVMGGRIMHWPPG